MISKQYFRPTTYTNIHQKRKRSKKVDSKAEVKEKP
jgi:hypothetical protein